MALGFTKIRQSFLTSNSYGQTQNCYFCTVAALLDMTADELVKKTEIMMQDTATLEEILTLFKKAGIKNITVQEMNPYYDIPGFVKSFLLLGHAVGLAYVRSNGFGHMVVLRQMHNSLSCIDYQKTPPEESDFPPEENLIKYFLFYREDGEYKMWD